MKTILLLAAIVILPLSSSKKKGCTDPSAINYSADVEKDDESCTYSWHVFFGSIL